MRETMQLGQTDVTIQALGVGTWQWGDRLMWGFGKDYGDDDVRRAFDASVEAGVHFFDTAEVYGLGRSERILGRLIDERLNGPPTDEGEVSPIVATKIFPFPWRLTRSQILGVLRRSLRRLRMERVDLYQVHFPPLLRSLEFWGNALADAVDAGLTRAVGVSNFDAEQTGRIYNALADRGVPLASNQIEYSLLHRQPERNGQLQTCRDLGVTVIAYSPLAKGVLTGKYTPDNPPPGPRSRIYDRERLTQIQPLIELMREIGAEHGEKTPAQVALNWTICKGTVPIPGAKNARHAESNAGALGWRLTDDEVAALDEASAGVSE
jgi:aryl-alcohol dehydrogenase-like predicted oxidoreductase